MSKDIKKLINEYKINAEKHGIATNEDDHKVANKFHDKLIKVLKKLRILGDEASAALLDLTDDGNESIRCWAATHSLNYNTEKAERTLQDLQKQSGPVAFDAEIVLTEWKKGTLEIP